MYSLKLSIKIAVYNLSIVFVQVIALNIRNLRKRYVSNRDAEGLLQCQTYNCVNSAIPNVHSALGCVARLVTKTI